MEHKDHVKHFNLIKEQSIHAFANAGHTPPHIVAIKDNKISIFFIAEMGDELQKDQVAHIMMQLIYDGAEAICFVCEGWSLEGAMKKGEDDGEVFKNDLAKYGAISNHPSRVEVLLLNYSWKDGEIWGTAPIVRQEYDPWDEDADLPDPNLPDVELGDWRVVDNTTVNGHSEGRFCGLWEEALSPDYEPIKVKCVDMDRENKDDIEIREIESFREIWES